MAELMKGGKRLRTLRPSVDRTRLYGIDEAFALVKKTANAKFDESVEVAVNLGIDPRKSEQNVRGSAVMPRGTGKTVRVAVFAEGEAAAASRKAGADVVGFQDLADQVKAGNLNFDVVIATPEAMRIVGQLGQILGPRGLMPNPKVGTVTPNPARAVENAKAGQVQYRADKAGIVHCAIGKVSFTEEALKENFLALVAALQKAKPSAAKGIYVKRVTISATMGPGIRLDQGSLPQ
jgi:large subunit ribosomal protein L1